MAGEDQYGVINRSSFADFVTFLNLFESNGREVGTCPGGFIIYAKGNSFTLTEIMEILTACRDDSAVTQVEQLTKRSISITFS